MREYTRGAVWPHPPYIDAGYAMAFAQDAALLASDAPADPCTACAARLADALQEQEGLVAALGYAERMVRDQGVRLAELRAAPAAATADRDRAALLPPVPPWVPGEKGKGTQR